jgi:hypothetical protein
MRNSTAHVISGSLQVISRYKTTEHPDDVACIVCLTSSPHPRTLYADMSPRTKSRNVRTLSLYCTRTGSVACQLGWLTVDKACRSARVRVQSAYAVISFSVSLVYVQNLSG